MLKKLSIALVALIMLLSGLVYGLLSSSLPKVDGVIKVKGTQADIAIHFDDYQRPFVDAQNLADALYAQGWLHASHRLWQMELFRRAAQGKLAALLGKSMIDTDKELYRLGVPQLVKRLEQNSSTEYQQLIDSYVSGVNQAINQLSVLPPEFLLLQAEVVPWTAQDVYAVGALMAFQSANNYKNELLRLGLFSELPEAFHNVFVNNDNANQQYPYIVNRSINTSNLLATINRAENTDPNDTLLMPRFAFGSNGWVVSPEKSATGNALFAFDSHDSLGLPNLFYEVHLFFKQANQDRQLRGWSVAGLPGVINGFNESIAWGFTNIGDTQDLFIETAHPSKKYTFKDDNSWYQAKTESYPIEVAGQSEPVMVEVTETKNGYLISDQPAIAIRWTIQDIKWRSIDAILAFNLAQGWQAFNQGLDKLAAPSLNATYADNQGNIGFRTAGLLPLRAKGEGLFPLAGDKSENRWQGLVNTNDMPSLFNPTAGFIAAANARVNALGNGVLVSADNAADYRIQRLQNVLASKNDFTLNDMEALQGDWYDQQAVKVLPAMLEELVAVGNQEASIAAQLSKWLLNPVAEKNSTAALIFQYWYRQLAKDLLASQLSEPLLTKVLKKNYLVNHALDYLLIEEKGHTWWQNKRQQFIQQSFNTTVAALSAQLGDDHSSWQLQRLHQVKLSHELGKAVPELDWLFNSKRMPWGGSTSTVGRANYRYSKDFDVSHGATVRVIAELTDTIDARASIPGGQSGHPLSDHYLDQFGHWLMRKTTKIAAHPSQVKSNQLYLIRE